LHQLLDLQQAYPVEQHFIFGDNSQRFTGTLLRGDDARSLKGRLKLSGSDPSQFDQLLSLTSVGNLPKRMKYHISGDINNQINSLVLSNIDANIGGTHIRGQLSYALQPGGQLPLLSGQLSSPSLGSSQSAGQTKAASSAGGVPASWYQQPLPALPTTLQTDIKLRIGKLSIAGIQLSKLHTTATLRDGTLKLAPLNMQLDGDRIAATLSYSYGHSQIQPKTQPTTQPKTRSKPVAASKPSASILLQFNNPGFERRIPLGNAHPGADLVIKGSKGHTRLRSHGRNIDQWQQNLDLSNRLESLSVSVIDAQQQILSHAELKNPRISRAPGKPFLLKGSGDYDRQPLTVNGRASLTANGKPAPFSFSATAGDLHIKLSGRLNPEKDMGVEQLEFKLQAQHSRSLPLLLRSPLAAQGPYLFEAKLTSEGERYQINDLKVRAGENDIGGLCVNQ